MSPLETQWRKRQARCEDGIYLATGEFVELCGDPGSGYRADLPASIETLLRMAPTGWTKLDELCSAHSRTYSVFAGATSFEGSGFVALEDRALGKLIWLLQLTNSEPFVEITCDDSIIRAVSEEYPFSYRWKIPIDPPEDLRVSLIDKI